MEALCLINQLLIGELKQLTRQIQRLRDTRQTQEGHNFPPHEGQHNLDIHRGTEIEAESNRARGHGPQLAPREEGNEATLGGHVGNEELRHPQQGAGELSWDQRFKNLQQELSRVNLLPYTMYKQLGLGELKPTNITLSLADRLVKIPKGIVEDVLVKVDNFYYPMDFVVLDTEPMAESPHQVPIILGRPFLATTNAIINCRNGVMQLTFGNLSMELNIFHLCNRNKLAEDKEQKSEEVCQSGKSEGRANIQELQK